MGRTGTCWIISRASPKGWSTSVLETERWGAHPGEEKASEELWFPSNISENLNQFNQQKVAKPKSSSTLWKYKFGFEVGGDNGFMTATCPSWFSKAEIEIRGNLPPFLGTSVDHLHLGLLQPFLPRDPAAVCGSKTASKQASTGQLPFLFHA